MEAIYFRDIIQSDTHTHAHIFIAQQWPLLPCFSLCVVYWLFVDVISAFSFQANKYPQNTSTKKRTAPSETDRQHFTFCKWWGQRVYILWNIAASLPYGTRWKAFSLLHFIAAITNSLLQSVSTNPHRIYMELRGMREKKMSVWLPVNKRNCSKREADIVAREWATCENWEH